MKHILSGIFTILNKREKLKLGQLIVFDLAIGLLDVVFLGLLLIVINFYTKNNVPASVRFLPKALLDPNSLTLIGVFLLLFSAKNWLGYLGLRSQHHFFYNIASRLSKRNILNYLKDDYYQFVNVDSSVRIRKISHQPIEFSHYVLTNFQQAIAQSILIFFTVCAILVINPTLFVLLFLILLPPVVAVAWYIRKKLKGIRATTRLFSQKTIQHLQEALAGYVEGNVYKRYDFFIDRYDQFQRQLNENLATMQSLQSLPSRLIEVFAVLGFFVLIMVNKWSANAPAVDLFTIAVFMAASYKIIPGVVKILNCTGQMKTYQFTIADLLHSNYKTAGENRSPVSSVSSIKFQQVHFDYKDHGLLNGLSFEMMPGDFVGISGVSGKGKTTFINLLLGFLEPCTGNILINDEIISGVYRQRYWDRISYVKQQPFFINDSVLKNITLDDGDYHAERMEEVLSFCGIDQLLDKYPNGLEHVVKENGKNISGGQRQRIMLARALYRDFDLLILDEPFGEMDHNTENDILKQLKALTGQGKMILFITHNKASLSFCNKVYSLDEE